MLGWEAGRWRLFLARRQLYSGAFSDTGALTVGDATNVGTVVLIGTNTYSGGRDLNGGVLAVNTDANLGTGGLTFNGGNLEVLMAGRRFVSAKEILLNAGWGNNFNGYRNGIDVQRQIGGTGSLPRTAPARCF